MDASSTSPVVIDETSARYDGWRIVGVCFLVATFGWGLGFYGQSVYLAELHRLRGWPTSLISTATTFFYLFGAVLVAFVSEAVRSFGPRNCLLGGAVATIWGVLFLIALLTVLRYYTIVPWHEQEATQQSVKGQIGASQVAVVLQLVAAPLWQAMVPWFPVQVPAQL